MEAMVGMIGLGLCGAALVVIVVTLILHSVRREQERKTALEHWAASRGWTVIVRPHEAEWADQRASRREGAGLESTVEVMTRCLAGRCRRVGIHHGGDLIS